MGAGEEEERGWAQVPGGALPELVVELPLVPGEMMALDSEAGAHLPGNAPGVCGGEAAAEPFEVLRMQDEAGPGYCLQPSLGSVCSSRGQSSWEPHEPVPPGRLAPGSSGTALGLLRCHRRHPSTTGLARQELCSGKCGSTGGSWREAEGSRGKAAPLLCPVAASLCAGLGQGQGKRGAGKAELQRVRLPRTQGCCSVVS